MGQERLRRNAMTPAPTASIAAATEAMMATDAPVVRSAPPSMMAMMRPGFSLSAARASASIDSALSLSNCAEVALPMSALACARAVSNAFHDSAVYFDPSSFSASLALIYLSSSDLLTGAGYCEF